MGITVPLSPEDYLTTQWNFFWHYWYVWTTILTVALISWLLSRLE